MWLGGWACAWGGLDTESEDLHGFGHGLLVYGSLFLSALEFLRLLFFDVVFDGVVHGEVVFCGFGEGSNNARELGGVFQREIFALLCLQLEQLVVEQFDVEFSFLEDVVFASIFGEGSCDRSVFSEGFSCSQQVLFFVVAVVGVLRFVEAVLQDEEDGLRAFAAIEQRCDGFAKVFLKSFEDVFLAHAYCFCLLLRSEELADSVDGFVDSVDFLLESSEGFLERVQFVFDGQAFEFDFEFAHLCLHGVEVPFGNGGALDRP